MLAKIFQTILEVYNHDMINYMITIFTQGFMIVYLIYDALTLQLSSQLSIFFALVAHSVAQLSGTHIVI